MTELLRERRRRRRRAEKKILKDEKKIYIYIYKRLVSDLRRVHITGESCN